MSVFAIGISGIQLAQAGMQVTQHNITNSGTSGYNRQNVIQTEASAVGFASGFMGNGVKITTVQRQYSGFLTNQVREADTQLASLDSYFGQIETIDNLLADANAGVSPAIQDFFAAVQQVATYPASLPARQSLVSSAEAMTSRFQGASSRISELYSQVNTEIEDNVQLVNTYAKQIAALNQNIITSEAAVNQPANDLRDQRDQLITELNKIVKVQTIPLAQNGIEVLIGKGQLLVMGTQSFGLGTQRSSADPARTAVTLDQGNGAEELPEGIITGGKLGGLLSFRSETLDNAMNSLGKVAASLALTFNAQHAQGMDLLGNSLGGTDANGNTLGLAGALGSNFISNFFTLPQPKVIPSDPTSPTVTAKFTTPKLTSDLATGNYFTDLPGSDYRLDYDGTQFNLVRLDNGTSWSAASVSALNTMLNDPTAAGYKGAQGIEISSGAGTFQLGQSYLIEPTRETAANINVDSRIVGDVRLVAAAQPVRATVGVRNTGTLEVNVARVRTEDANLAGVIPTPASRGTSSPTSYPVSFQVNANGTLQLTAPTGTTLTLNVIDVNGNVTTEDISDTVPTTSSVGAGRSFELWDGTSRILLTTTGNYAAAGTDTFSIDSNAQSSPQKMLAVSDSGNMVLLGKLLTQSTSDSATSTFQGAYAQMVADIGNKAREIEVTKNAQKTLADQAAATRDGLSGVNLDEEAANLLRYQQLYQAAARSINVGQKMFDELLAIARG